MAWSWAALITNPSFKPSSFESLVCHLLVYIFLTYSFLVLPVHLFVIPFLDKFEHFLHFSSMGGWSIFKFRTHGTVSSPLDPWCPFFWDMRRILCLGKLLFSGIRGLNSQMFTFKFTQADYFKIVTKCRADGTKKSSRKSVFPVKSTVSKEEERNYQWKREKKIATSSVRVELKKLLIEEKINKLEQDCKRLQCETAGLKRTIQTLRRSIGKCLLK